VAANKTSFLLYTDVYYTVKKLTDEQAGQLFKIILGYVNDENPVIKDFILELAFEPIKQALKRDLRKYETIREKRSLAGKASADKRQQMLTSVDTCEQMPTNSTVIDNVIVIDNEEEIPPPPSPKKPSIKERNFEYLPLAKELSRIVQETKHIEHTRNQLYQWSSDIRQLVENNKVSVERIQAGLQYLKEHAGEQYCPVIESGSALRDKFGKLEGQMKPPTNMHTKYFCPSNWKFGIDWEEGKEGCRRCEEFNPKIYNACVTCYRNSKKND